jgi:phosphopantothenoylcysteine decarboxylase/phosphopantothenate--cysteine ligase
MKDRKIVVGITGGIAAYKAAELVRLLVKAGADVRVGMTANATRFVAPLTYEALSGNSVIWDMFGKWDVSINHVSWGQDADLIIIAPATANFIAKMAHGIADDFLSTMLLAATAKIMVCPSMNSKMLENTAVQKNLKQLMEMGIAVMKPAEGELACRDEGPGRLPDPEKIFEQAWALLSRQDLAGLSILITAGPTIEPIDPVRYITNRSTGKMGYALARAAWRRGASVKLVSGPATVNPPYGVSLFRVKTAEEMRQAVLKHCTDCDIIIKAAAVSDYRPQESSRHKIKKGAECINLELVKNPDILAELGSKKEESPCILVGFAAETKELIGNAREKLKAKNLDMIIANDVSRDDAGFEADTNKIKLIFSDGRLEDTSLMTKDEVADLILDRIKSLRR